MKELVLGDKIKNSRKLRPGNNRARFIGATKQILLSFGEDKGDALSLARDISSAIKKFYSDTPSATAFDRFNIPLIVRGVETAEILCETLGPDRTMISSIILAQTLSQAESGAKDYLAGFGQETSDMVSALTKIYSLYLKSPSVRSDNFRDLLLTMAADIRVVILMIVDRLALMRAINHHPSEQMVKDVALETSYLYSPLAHRLGLYSIKSELEDLSLKYTSRDVYLDIAHKLNETKNARDAYIASFIAPVKEALTKAGLKFEIKGRTKSIYSIWNKMRKQHNDLEHIYDLFAIRVVIDCEPIKEKSDCWLAYSIITDMFRPNPARMKDWISIPKSNGYESLHTTVYGPDNKWVEVQIRTRRMDLVAEKGLAAHWKYKGLKSDDHLDNWMNNVRDILDTAQSGPMELIKNMKMDIYDKEVFVFTPKGDLYRLAQGASLLDFAFHIHTNLGCQCIGGRINGRNCKINTKLQSGDTVEIFTSPSQTPKQDWLAFTVTSKARNKIRIAVKEQESRQADLGKETLYRRLKNRKIEVDEAIIGKIIKKAGYKTVTEFFTDINKEVLNINSILESYQEFLNDSLKADETKPVSASEFILEKDLSENIESNPGAIIIGDNVTGVNYRMGKCCNPIYGDDVFGFISSEGIIKIHRKDCPNAIHLCHRYPYRTIPVEWSGKVGDLFQAVIKIIGTDDISLVTKVTSLIAKEKDIVLRNISIDSVDGLFQGFLVVGVQSTTSLNRIIKKLQTIKGIKNVERSK